MSAPADKNPQTLDCKGCGAPLHVRAPGFSVAVVCESCGSITDASDEKLVLIEKSEKAIPIKSAIPLGTRGFLRGIEQELIGIMLRTDASGEYGWGEYLLFNPYHGFRWLVCYNGHWTYVRTVKDTPAEAGSVSVFRSTSFQRFITGKSRVKHVLGEFYWRVRRGDTVDCADFIHPPYILSLESDGSERIWSLGEYLSGDEVYAAFGITLLPPSRSGVGACQPNPYSKNRGSTIFLAACFILLAFIMQVLAVSRARDEVVFNHQYSFPDPKSTIITPSFALGGESANIALSTHSKPDNTWTFFEITLVNESTGEDFAIAREVAYYHGTDSDGSWSEGSWNDKVVLSAIPGGTYHLEIDPSREDLVPGQLPTGAAQDFSVTLTRDVPYWGIFAFVAVLLILPPAFIFWRHSAFEKQRWSESDYADDDSDDDDD